MAALADLPYEQSAALRAQAALLARPMTVERRMADAVRALIIDMTEAAQDGHPGMGMGMADAATGLWTRGLKYDAADPHWPDRDRFVMSARHGTALLHALLHLTGHAGADPRAPMPDYGAHPAVETAMGGPGQGLAHAVGMALAERLMAARFGKSLVDHRTWVIACNADLAEGVSHEAASLAGHLRLEKLTVLYDDSGATLGAQTALATSEDVLKRFAACGWAVQRIDGHDPDAISSALSFAVRARKPTLLALRTIIGFGAPTKAGLPQVDAGPLGLVEAAAAKHTLGWDHGIFSVPNELAEPWHDAGLRGATARRAWLKRLARHPQRSEFERVVAGRLPDGWREVIATTRADFAPGVALPRSLLATAAASQQILAALASAVPELVAGLTDLTADVTAAVGITAIRGAGTVAPGSYGGRTILYGHREHAMAAVGNGLALHGGVIAADAAALAASDTMRPALRLAGAMRQRVIHVLLESTDAQAAPDQLAGLRAIPTLRLFRPADAIETAECWELALLRADGPSLLVLSRTPVAPLRPAAGENRCTRGGYVLAEADGPRQVTLIATGGEVAAALAARVLLANGGVAAAVVSLPCWDLFALQDGAWQERVLGTAPRVGVEAAGGFGWERWLGRDGQFIGLDGSGGPTVDAIVGGVTKRLS